MSLVNVCDYNRMRRAKSVASKSARIVYESWDKYKEATASSNYYQGLSKKHNAQPSSGVNFNLVDTYRFILFFIIVGNLFS